MAYFRTTWQNTSNSFCSRQLKIISLSSMSPREQALKKWFPMPKNNALEQLLSNFEGTHPPILLEPNAKELLEKLRHTNRIIRNLIVNNEQLPIQSAFHLWSSQIMSKLDDICVNPNSRDEFEIRFEIDTLKVILCDLYEVTQRRSNTWSAVAKKRVVQLFKIGTFLFDLYKKDFKKVGNTLSSLYKEWDKIDKSRSAPHVIQIMSILDIADKLEKDQLIQTLRQFQMRYSILQGSSYTASYVEVYAFVKLSLKLCHHREKSVRFEALSGIPSDSSNVERRTALAQLCVALSIYSTEPSKPGKFHKYTQKAKGFFQHGWQGVSRISKLGLTSLSGSDQERVQHYLTDELSKLAGLNQDSSAHPNSAIANISKNLVFAMRSIIPKDRLESSLEKRFSNNIRFGPNENLEKVIESLETDGDRIPVLKKYRASNSYPDYFQIRRLAVPSDLSGNYSKGIIPLVNKEINKWCLTLNPKYKTKPKTLFLFKIVSKLIEEAKIALSHSIQGNDPIIMKECYIEWEEICQFALDLNKKVCEHYDPETVSNIGYDFLKYSHKGLSVSLLDGVKKAKEFAQLACEKALKLNEVQLLKHRSGAAIFDRLKSLAWIDQNGPGNIIRIRVSAREFEAKVNCLFSPSQRRILNSIILERLKLYETFAHKYVNILSHEVEKSEQGKTQVLMINSLPYLSDSQMSYDLIFSSFLKEQFSSFHETFEHFVESVSRDKRNCITMQGVFFGTKQLKNVFEKQMFSSPTRFKSQYPDAKRTVLSIKDGDYSIHVKVLPKMPGTEFAVNCLTFLLFHSFDTNPSELFLLKRYNNEGDVIVCMPLLVSKTVPGNTLDELERDDKNWKEFNYDPGNLARLMVVGLLAHFEDSHTNNYLCNQSDESPTLTAIDTDHAFVYSVKDQSTNKPRETNSIYEIGSAKAKCIPNDVKQALISQRNIHTLLNIWIVLLNMFNWNVNRVFNKDLRKQWNLADESRRSILWSTFNRGQIGPIFLRLYKIRQFISRNPNVTIGDLQQHLRPNSNEIAMLRSRSISTFTDIIRLTLKEIPVEPEDFELLQYSPSAALAELRVLADNQIVELEAKERLSNFDSSAITGLISGTKLGKLFREFDFRDWNLTRQTVEDCYIDPDNPGRSFDSAKRGIWRDLQELKLIETFSPTQFTNDHIECAIPLKYLSIKQLLRRLQQRDSVYGHSACVDNVQKLFLRIKQQQQELVENICAINTDVLQKADFHLKNLALLTDSNIINICKQHSQLKCLTLSGGDIHSPAISKIVAIQEQLEELYLENLPFSRFESKLFQNGPCYGKLSTLKKLVIKDCSKFKILNIWSQRSFSLRKIAGYILYNIDYINISNCILLNPATIRIGYIDNIEVFVDNERRFNQ